MALYGLGTSILESWNSHWLCFPLIRLGWSSSMKWESICNWQDPCVGTSCICGGFVWTSWGLYTGWWFGTSFIFPNSWDDDPIWRTHIFQRGRAQPPISIVYRDLVEDLPPFLSLSGLKILGKHPESNGWEAIFSFSWWPARGGIPVYHGQPHFAIR